MRAKKASTPQQTESKAGYGKTYYIINYLHSHFHTFENKRFYFLKFRAFQLYLHELC